jgi:hypothetical protein
MRHGAQTYAAWVMAEDWPQMVAGEPRIRPVPPGLREAMDAVVHYDSEAAGQRAALQSALITIERAIEARRNRVLLSRQVIDPVQWTVVWLFYVFLIITISLIHLDRPVTNAIAIWLYSSTFALCLVLLVLNDGPFRIGGSTVGPTVLKELSAD